MCKRGRILIFLSVITVLLLPFVNANFVCGTIQDAEDISAAWMNVQVFYTDNPTQKTECKVSPQENKFCCDPQEITTVNWAIGKEINAKIIQDNYVTPQKSLIISGEGYDVFEEMQLEKVITLHTPNTTIFLNQTNVTLNITTIPEFNSLRYKLISPNEIIDEELCTNCNQATFNKQNLAYGTHKLTVYAKNAEGDEINTSWQFTNLQYITFSRKIECNRCGDQYVLVNSLVNVTVILNLSHNATGKFSDYFPAQWNFIGNENIEEFGQSHGKVTWEITGKDIQRTYQIAAPAMFFPRRYYFRSEFGDHLSEKYRVIVRRFHSFLPINIDFIPEPFPNIYGQLYLEISPENPLVMNINHTNLVQVALFPNETLQNAYGYVRTEETEQFSGALLNFNVGSNVNDHIEQTLVKFKVAEPASFFFELESATLYHYNPQTDSWEEQETTQYDQEGSHTYFESLTDQKGIFAIDADYGLSFI